MKRKEKKITCKRCGQELLLRSELEISLCSLCQKVLCRPSLIEPEPDFERTNNEPVYLIDDLYCSHDNVLEKLEAAHRSPPRVPLPESLAVSHSPSKHRLRWSIRLPSSAICGTARLFISTIVVIVMFLTAIKRLHPHLIGFDGLDLLAMTGLLVSLIWWWKEMRENVK